MEWKAVFIVDRTRRAFERSYVEKRMTQQRICDKISISLYNLLRLETQVTNLRDCEHEIIVMRPI